MFDQTSGKRDPASSMPGKAGATRSGGKRCHKTRTKGSIGIDPPPVFDDGGLGARKSMRIEPAGAKLWFRSKNQSYGAVWPVPAYGSSLWLSCRSPNAVPTHGEFVSVRT